MQEVYSERAHVPRFVADVRAGIWISAELRLLLPKMSNRTEQLCVALVLLQPVTWLHLYADDTQLYISFPYTRGHNRFALSETQ